VAPTGPPSTDERLDRGAETALGVPVVGWSVTYNEAHAVTLGAALGTVSGLVAVVHVAVGVTILTTVAVYGIVGFPAFGCLDRAHQRPRHIGRRTLRYEPWWALAGLVPPFLAVVALV